VELTLKVLSLEKTALGKADGINGPAGHSSLSAKASTESHPGVRVRIEPHREITW
jgi:hypothetical protein